MKMVHISSGDRLGRIWTDEFVGAPRLRGESALAQVREPGLVVMSTVSIAVIGPKALELAN